MTPPKETNEAATTTPEQTADDALPLSNAVVSEAATRAGREAIDAGLIPAAHGGELPLQAATEAVLETTTLSAQTVQEKAVSGAKILGVRTLVGLGLRVISSLTLSHFLFPQNYGIFAATAGIAGVAQYFCDAGMGSVLVMQEREPTDDEITTVFWLQQIFTTVIVVLILACIPLLLSFYKAPVSATPYLVAMALALYPASARLVPALRLERELNFERQARAEMIENIAQVAVGVTLAVLHFGTWALVGGAVTGRVVGLITIYCVAPWTPRGHFRKNIALRFAARGGQFQINVIAPSVFGSVFSMVISRMLGVVGLGFFGWAANLATVPLMVSVILNRVAFSSMSRLQSHQSEVGRKTSVLVRRVSLTLSVCFAPVIIFSPIFLPLIFGYRWVSAVPLFQWGIMDTINYTSIGMLGSVMLATGHLTPRLIGAVVGGAAKVLLLYIAIRLLGIHGVGMGSYFGTLIELGFLGFYTRKYIEGSNTILHDIALPIIGVQVSAAIGLAVAYCLFGVTAGLNGPAFWSAATGIGIFAAGLLLYNAAVKGRPVTTELSGIVRLLKSR